MIRNYVFEDVSDALPKLLGELEHADEVGSRNGRTKELMHVGITLENPWRREVLVEHRKPSIAAQIAETMWVLAGRDDIDWLGHYLPRAKDFSDDGSTWRAGYGKRIRQWESVMLPGLSDRRSLEYIDQLQFVVDLLKQDHLSRRAVVSIWDPTIDTEPGKDIPCNDWLSFSSRFGKLDLHVAVRSNDAMWGWSGINAFEWSALQEVVAGLLGLEVGGLHFSVTSFHLYTQHWAKAQKIVEASAMSVPPTRAKDSPRFDAFVVNRDLSLLDSLMRSWFTLEENIRTGKNVDELVHDFPEPMMRSWLRVLQWWWTSDRSYLGELEGTALERATHFSIQPPMGEPVNLFPGESINTLGGSVSPFSPFIEYACKTHNEKHAAYGDSWKRRGEMLGIMANIARKIDRLGKSETSDETSADTAMDLMVYLAKYRVWLSESIHVGGVSDGPDAANRLMKTVEVDLNFEPWPDFSREGAVRGLEEMLRIGFDQLENAVTKAPDMRVGIVEAMLHDAYRLARTLYENQDEYRGADAD